MAIHLTVALYRRQIIALMQGKLMAMQVNIDPVGRITATATPNDTTVKIGCLFQVVYQKGQMKGRLFFHRLPLLLNSRHSV